jgi:hypothetical protein
LETSLHEDKIELERRITLQKIDAPNNWKIA